MNFHLRYNAPAKEKPLDNYAPDGGFASIFRTVAFVGDSLSSGEFETYDPQKDLRRYCDMYEYSWGQYAARMAGFTAYNFSRGGMTAAEYCETFADMMDLWNPDRKAQAYVIALGVNEMIYSRPNLGEMSDIDPENPTNNKKTFTGYYARIIQQYKAIQPNAKFFLITIPRQPFLFETTPAKATLVDAHAARLHELAAYFDNTYVLDFRAFGPVQDEEFTRRFYMESHMNALGYRLFAEQFCSYVDYLVRHNPEDFTMVPFIGREELLEG